MPSCIYKDTTAERRTPMNSGDKITLIDNEHDLDKILKTNDRVIALIYASWCPFCRRFLPVFQQYAQEEQKYFLCVQDDEGIIGEKYSIDIFPSVLFFEKGSISKRLDGKPGVGLSEKQLAEFIMRLADDRKR
jgi:thiol-disulfide isomerase/thioredoxin